MPNVLYDALLAGRSRGDGQLFLKTECTAGVSDAEFFTLGSSMATVLIDAGVHPGDRVAVQVSKSVEALALYIACVQAGAVFLPLNTAYTEEELKYFLQDAEPRVLVVDPAFDTRASLIAGDAQVLTLSASGEGSLVAQAQIASPLQRAVVRAKDDLAAILYTSGTTGRSKGAMLTHANLLSNAQILQETWRFTADDVLLHALPIFHTHGLFVACNLLMLCGGRMLFLPGFSVEPVLQIMPCATTMMGVPTFYTRLLADERFTAQCVKHMRLFISGSAPLLADTHREFESRTGQRILERYGMTETNMNTSNPYDGERIAGTVGLALPQVEVRVCDQQSNKELGVNEVGVLHVKGPNVFAGYWQMPEKTAEELLADGFFITGDLASIDEKGYITIVGRSKDLIISGGYNIYPKEIELLIDDLPGVLESAVVGVQHADFGEAVVAVVVREAGEKGELMTEELVRESLQHSLARFKWPKRVFFVEELPRNAMGKVQKNTLRDQLGNTFVS